MCLRFLILRIIVLPKQVPVDADPERKQSQDWALPVAPGLWVVQGGIRVSPFSR